MASWPCAGEREGAEASRGGLLCGLAWWGGVPSPGVTFLPDSAFPGQFPVSDKVRKMCEPQRLMELHSTWATVLEKVSISPSVLLVREGKQPRPPIKQCALEEERRLPHSLAQAPSFCGASDIRRDLKVSKELRASQRLSRERVGERLPRILSRDRG